MVTTTITTTTMTGQDMIQRLILEDFNLQTEKTLKHHLYIQAAEQGTLTIRQKQAFCYEQYWIQLSDAISFARLAGHDDSTLFHPRNTLIGITAPPPPCRRSQQEQQQQDEATTTTNNASTVPDLFQFLLEGEIYAAPLLLRYASYLGIETAETSLQQPSNNNYTLHPLAQAYPSYWARMALSSNSSSSNSSSSSSLSNSSPPDIARMAGAAACAVNFPAWGQMCQRLYQAEAKQQKIKEANQTKTEPSNNNDDNSNTDPLAFIQFFATPIDNLNEMAAAVINQELDKKKKKDYKIQNNNNDNDNNDNDDNDEEENELLYQEIKRHVRLLQEYEVLFWDAIYDATE